MSVVVNNKEDASFEQKLEAIINKNRRKCTLSEEMLNLLVKQISHELFNKNVYQTFANYFSVNHLPKLKEYYTKRAEEEYLHAKWIINYLNKCDAEYSMPKVGEVKIDIKNFEHTFDLTVDLEIYTTMCINNIAQKALEEKDFTTFNWLNGNSPTDGKLILEQQEEETTSRIVAGIAHMDTDWLSKQDSIMEYYGSI